MPDDTAECVYRLEPGFEITLNIRGEPRRVRRIPPVPADAPRCRLCSAPLPCPHGHPNSGEPAAEREAVSTWTR